MAEQKPASTREILFRVTTATPLPAGQQVFVTGKQQALGSWAPDGFPLTRVDDNLWTGSAELPAEPVEYKLTRGTWASEEVREDESVPANYSVTAGGDRTVRHVVHHWKDHLLGSPPQITGDYRIHEGFRSRHLRFPRKVIVWLPPSYEKEADRRYPVLYMPDGQQVFDPRTSTWNHDWQVDEWCARLIAEERLQEIIVVAAYSTDDRYLEYNPSQIGPDYGRFVIEELKSFIDEEYRTLPGRATTAVAGASMGATISFYMAWTRPDIFSAAACLSPAFRFKGDQFNLDMVRSSPAAPDVRVYLYCGAGDDLEQRLMPGMREMASLLRKAGLKDGHNLLVQEDDAGLHNEATWARQTGQWLQFLFGV